MDDHLPPDNPPRVSRSHLRDAPGSPVRQPLLGVHLLLCLPPRPPPAPRQHSLVLPRPDHPLPALALWTTRVCEAPEEALLRYGGPHALDSLLHGGVHHAGV